MEYRWLLPFTYGIDHHAIETAVRLADAKGATLVSVALVAISSGRRPSDTRLEHIQQAKDFLVLVQSVAARYQVQVECHEVFTGAVNRCIKMLIQDLCCDGIVAVMRADQTLLLQRQEVSELLAKPPTALVLTRIPLVEEKSQQWRFLSWFHEWWKSQGYTKQECSVSLDDKPSQVRIPEYCAE